MTETKSAEPTLTLPDELRAALVARAEALKAERAQVARVRDQAAARVVELGGQIVELERLLGKR